MLRGPDSPSDARSIPAAIVGRDMPVWNTTLVILRELCFTDQDLSERCVVCGLWLDLRLCGLGEARFLVCCALCCFEAQLPLLLLLSEPSPPPPPCLFVSLCGPRCCGVCCGGSASFVLSWVLVLLWAWFWFLAGPRGNCVLVSVPRRFAETIKG